MSAAEIAKLHRNHDLLKRMRPKFNQQAKLNRSANSFVQINVSFNSLVALVLQYAWPNSRWLTLEGVSGSNVPGRKWVF
jgi:hypothetical protein